MSLRTILERIRHEWRQLGVLLLSICLVTAFFALGPLYTRAATQSGLKFELSRATAADKQLTFISPTPFKPASWDIVNRQLGAVNGGLVRISRTGGAIGGFDFLYGEPTTELTPRSGFGSHIFAFSNLRDLLKLAAGRWPNRLPPPNSPERNATTQEDAIAKGVGVYSRGDVEAVMTSFVSRVSGYQIGARFVVGERPENRVVVHLVGIVEAVNPDDPIWDTNIEALKGELITTTPGKPGHFDMGFFVTEGAYADWIAAATRSRTAEINTYVWQITLKTDAITSDNFQDVNNRLLALNSKFTNDYPGLLIIGSLNRLLGSYTTRVDSASRPVLLLSGAILLLMLYHLVTTVGLVLEQQMGEWSSLSSRGASTSQLILLQLATVVLLCAVGFVVGPLLASVILQGLARVGPLAVASGGEAPPPGIPNEAYFLSAIAAIAAVVVLTLPAIPAARRSLAQFKQIVARPPSRPIWARFWLDLIFILLGLAFLARLLFFISGDLGQTLSLLVTNPRQLIQLILDSANQTGGLGDPLNLLGPALLLTGVALFWLRLFPALMHLIGSFTRRNNGLTGPLSVWNVERDPGHYAQLVLLLIGTLVLGTAAISLGATRDTGAWASARTATGGAARVDYDPAAFQTTTWPSSAGVKGVALIVHAETEYKAGRTQVFLAGLNPQQVVKIFPETVQTLAALDGQTVEKGVVPVIISERMAVEEGQALREDRLPLEVGTVAQVDLPMPNRTITLKYKIVGITRNFLSFNEDQHFMILEGGTLEQAISGTAPNQLWLELADRQPSTDLITLLHNTSGVKAVTFAWDRYNELLREPLPAAIAGMLYAGFWVSLILGLLDFGFYLAVTARRRSLGFAVLQALGWNVNNIWTLLLAEQTALVIPALLIGIVLGAALAYVILPFLALAGGQSLVVPGSGILTLLVILLVGFAILLSGTARWLQRLNVNQVLRLGEE